MANREQELITALERLQPCSSGRLADQLNGDISLATVKRILSRLVAEGVVQVTGRGRMTAYSLSTGYAVVRPIDVETYYEREIDERVIHNGFNWGLLRETLPGLNLFTPAETRHLADLTDIFHNHVSRLSPTAYRKEMERLAIDLSWKSSQIEGNTYSLLETERLLKDRLTAAGKSHEEAVMLLNHKAAIDFIVTHPDFLRTLSVPRIEDIHSLLIKDLGVERNIRNLRVGVTGTNYRPLDNDFQIREALDVACALINNQTDVYQKALLAVLLLSYIQPFEDGNKRTARIVGNAILLEASACPLSYRTVDAIDYQKAMLIFYEQSNVSAFKSVFLSQYEFAVGTYF